MILIPGWICLVLGWALIILGITKPNRARVFLPAAMLCGVGAFLNAVGTLT